MESDNEFANNGDKNKSGYSAYPNAYTMPRGIEVLVKKASVDARFRKLLCQFGFYPDPGGLIDRQQKPDIDSCGAHSPRIEPQNLATRAS